MSNVGIVYRKTSVSSFGSNTQSRQLHAKPTSIGYAFMKLTHSVVARTYYPTRELVQLDERTSSAVVCEVLSCAAAGTANAGET